MMITTLRNGSKHEVLTSTKLKQCTERYGSFLQQTHINAQSIPVVFSHEMNNKRDVGNLLTGRRCNLTAPGSNPRNLAL